MDQRACRVCNASARQSALYTALNGTMASFFKAGYFPFKGPNGSFQGFLFHQTLKVILAGCNYILLAKILSFGPAVESLCSIRGICQSVSCVPLYGMRSEAFIYSMK